MATSHPSRTPADLARRPPVVAGIFLLVGLLIGLAVPAVLGGGSEAESATGADASVAEQSNAPDADMQARVEELEAAEADRDAAAVETMLDDVEGAHPIVVEMAAALRELPEGEVLDGAAASTAASSADEALALLASDESAATHVNLTRTSLSESVELLAQAAAADDAEALAALLHSADRVWSVGATLLDELAIEHGHGHVHLFLRDDHVDH